MVSDDDRNTVETSTSRMPRSGLSTGVQPVAVPRPRPVVTSVSMDGDAWGDSARCCLAVRGDNDGLSEMDRRFNGSRRDPDVSCFRRCRNNHPAKWLESEGCHALERGALEPFNVSGVRR